MAFRREAPGPHRVESPPSPSFLGNLLRTISRGHVVAAGVWRPDPDPAVRHPPPPPPASILHHQPLAQGLRCNSRNVAKSVGRSVKASPVIQDALHGTETG